MAVAKAPDWRQARGVWLVIRHRAGRLGWAGHGQGDRGQDLGGPWTWMEEVSPLFSPASK